MKSQIIKRVLYSLLVLLLLGSLLMLTPRIHGALFPDRPPVGYHFLWSSYLAIALGLEKVIDTTPDIPEDVAQIQNIEYKAIAGTSLQLDLYKKKQVPDGAPLIIFVHGGSWIKGKRKDMLPLVLDFADRGYVTATVSYRLGSYPECAEDVADAVKWLYRHGHDYGYDSERIALVGASAGAHLAMLAAYGWRNEAMRSDSVESEPRISAVVNLFGPVDLTTAYARSRSTVNSLIGEVYEKAPDLYLQASPVHYVDRNTPPTMIIHGTSDELVPVSQADQLKNKLDSAGIRNVDYRYPLWPHALILVQRVYDHCAPRMHDFLKEHLINQPNKP